MDVSFFVGFFFCFQQNTEAIYSTHVCMWGIFRFVCVGVFGFVIHMPRPGFWGIEILSVSSGHVPNRAAFGRRPPL